MIDGETQGVLTQLRAYLAHAGGLAGARLPPESQLAEELGVSRGTLRHALADLEAEGLIWRHVGRGTFIGNRPVDTVQDLSAVTRRTNPAVVMEARLSLEPEPPQLARPHVLPPSSERNQSTPAAQTRSGSRGSTAMTFAYHPMLTIELAAFGDWGLQTRTLADAALVSSSV